MVLNYVLLQYYKIQFLINLVHHFSMFQLVALCIFYSMKKVNSFSICP